MPRRDARRVTATPPAAVPDLVRFTTYNVLNLFEDDSARQREHYKLVVEVIRELDPDVLAVQEILAPDRRRRRPAVPGAGQARGPAGDDAGRSARGGEPPGAGARRSWLSRRPDVA